MRLVSRLKEKGGVGEIIATIMIAGLVVALAVAIIIPLANKANETGVEAKTNLTDVDAKIDALTP